MRGVGRVSLVYLMGDLYARPDTGELLRDRHGEWQDLHMRIPPTLLEARPAPRSESLDGAFWAAEVFELLA
jgi:hypothetical protein